MRVDIHVYVDERGDIAWDASLIECVSRVHIVTKGGYKTLANARRAYKRVAKLRGWEVANVYEAVEE